ncbi:hypothetical protein TNCV_1260821 [Trichonephila clavipes]|nr:hypothetical protein TNCV_1260821 [Trichonephila clavipes]
MVLKANDRRTSCPSHDEFRGPRSDYVRQVALATTTTEMCEFWLFFILKKNLRGGRFLSEEDMDEGINVFSINSKKLMV